MGRGIEKRTANDRFSPGDLDETALEQSSQRPGRVHPANLGDLRCGRGLTIGNHRQRLESLYRQSLRRAVMKQPTHPLIQLGPSDDLVATRDLNELEAATLVPFLLERLKSLGDMFLWLAIEDLRECF